ncbi:uncharacterized protein DS421_16g561510 [Arachis hypogaea]|nr:uncharacterized protein DS421_16g561510 [Arachis hypogaea]
MKTLNKGERGKGFKLVQGREDGTEEGEGKEKGHRRCSFPLRANPRATATSPLLLFFPVSDLLEPELTTGEELSQHSCCPPAVRHLRHLVTRNLKKVVGPRLIRRWRQAKGGGRGRRWRLSPLLSLSLFYTFDSIEEEDDVVSLLFLLLV